MAIEFSCPQCQHLLRTADDKAGLSAKCPACGEIIWVPYTTDTAAAAAGSATEPAAIVGGDGIPLAADDPAGPLDAAPASDASAAPPPAGEIPRRRSGAEVSCPGCHAVNDATAHACRFCGSSLDGAAPVQPEPPTIPPFDVSEIMSTAWRLYTQELGLMLGACVIMMFLPFLIILPCAIPVGIAAATMQEEEAIIIIVIAAFVILLPLLFAFGAAMQLGNIKLYLNVARGEGPSIRDLFWGFSAEGRPLILPALLVMVAAGALMLVGGVLCCAVRRAYS